MASKDGEQRSGLADAAGRAAFFPARAVARAWRTPIEEAVDEVLSAPEIARVLDRALAGSLPEELARSLARNRVLERIVAELAASGELERLVTVALGSPRTLELTDRVLASDETQRALGHVASSPELRDAIARQTTGLAEEVVGGVRASAARLDDRAEQIVRRPPANRATDLRRDRDARARARSRRGRDARHLHVDRRDRRADRIAGRRPTPAVARRRLARLRLGAGRRHVLRPLLELRGADAGNAAASRARSRPRGRPPSIARSLVRLVGLVLAIVPMFAGFIPVLFTERRRGLPDFLAGTVVLYDDTRG